MPIVNRTASVPYSAKDMYALVDDIASYSQFLPYCKATEVHSRNEDEVRASIVLGLGAIEKRFTTLNRLQPGKMIEIKLVDGPFKQLEGFWRFESIDCGSRISLDLNFEFSNQWVMIPFSKVFDKVANQLVDAFCARAKTLYE